MILARIPDNVVSERAARRVLLAAGDARFRTLARALLAQQPGIAVVAEAATAVETRQAARLVRPDIVLLDLDLPGGALRELIRTLRALPEPPAIVVMAWDDGEEYRQAARDVGASSCICRRDLDALFRPRAAGGGTGAYDE